MVDRRRDAVRPLRLLRRTHRRTPEFQPHLHHRRTLMKLSTLRLGGATAAVRVDNDTTATVIDGYPDVSALLAAPDWKTLAQNASGQTIDLATADYAPVVPSPGKIVCVGLNYATHIKEMGRELPEYPT